MTRPQLVVFLLVAALATAALVDAETASSQDEPVEALSRPPVVEVIVVTASLAAESSADLPASVEVIDSAEIEARQAISIADLLATASGIDVVRSGSAGKVTSLFSRGTESDHTLVLWNGIELNNPYFGGFDWAFLPAEGIERLEIVKGPFSALYGSDALGGAIQILSERTTGGTLRLEAGERGYGRGAVSLGTDFGKASLNLAGSFRSGDGLETNDFYRGSDLVNSLKWNLGARATIGLVTRFNESEVGLPRSSGVPSPQRRFDWSESQIAIPLGWQAGNWKVDAQLSSVSLDSSFRDPEDAFGFTASDTESGSDRFRTVATYTREEGSWAAFGTEIERLEVSDRSVFGVNLDRARQETRSGFAQALHSVGRLTLDLGARYDDSDVYGSRLTPRAGVLVAAGGSVRLRASYGEGFRAPSLGELFFQFSGNPALEPEESKSFEFGAEVEIGAWRLDVVGFENRLTNLIDFDFVNFTNVNIGKARTRGIEAKAAFEGARYRARANVNLLDTEDEATGRSLLRRPERKASLVLTRRQGNASVTATALYVGRRSDVDPMTFGPAENPSHVRLDLAGDWRGFERWQPYARLENALDESYEEALGFPAPPRSLVAGFAIRWQ